jgi:uncharacterized protein YPO0396
MTPVWPIQILRPILKYSTTARSEVLGEHRLTVESCDHREREMRDWLQKQIENETRKLSTLGRTNRQGDDFL